MLDWPCELASFAWWVSGWGRGRLLGIRGSVVVCCRAVLWWFAPSLCWCSGRRGCGGLLALVGAFGGRPLTVCHMRSSAVGSLPLWEGCGVVQRRLVVLGVVLLFAGCQWRGAWPLVACRCVFRARRWWLWYCGFSLWGCCHRLFFWFRPAYVWVGWGVAGLVSVHCLSWGGEVQLMPLPGVEAWNGASRPSGMPVVVWVVPGF